MRGFDKGVNILKCNVTKRAEPERVTSEPGKVTVEPGKVTAESEEVGTEQKKWAHVRKSHN